MASTSGSSTPGTASMAQRACSSSASRYLAGMGWSSMGWYGDGVMWYVVVRYGACKCGYRYGPARVQ